eukprot:Hpha_TRINITY_DN9392_c0_g1::TRINITY_DN9392_c0_g1_i1::g.25959::m.25959/K17553/PPP1R11; protein phosphatase 1 regulatory subunit 11
MTAMASAAASASIPTQVIDEPPQSETLVLRLRDGDAETQREKRVSWDESVRDSRPDAKRSNRCCVFHKRRTFGESDSESASSDDERTKSRRPIRCTRHCCDCNTTFN